MDQRTLELLQRAERDRMYYPPLTATRRSPLMGVLADNLAKAKQYGNKYEVKDWVPLMGGTGLGDMFMQEAPELADDVSYHGPSALIRGHYGRIPVPDRRTFDAAMLGLDVTGVTKGLGGLGRTVGKVGAKRLFSYPELASESRRDFLKKSAALGGAAAVGAAGLPALLTTGRNVARETATAVAPKHQYNSLREYSNALDDYAHDMAARSGTSSIAKINEARASLARGDAADYSLLKQGLTPKVPTTIYLDGSRHVDAFSPRAKYQMNAFKADKANQDKFGRTNWNNLETWLTQSGY